jgi:hypothetical protein
VATHRNNGTVKVDGTPFEQSQANGPTSDAFAIDFGFDQGALTGTATFEPAAVRNDLLG